MWCDCFIPSGGNASDQIYATDEVDRLPVRVMSSEIVGREQAMNHHSLAENNGWQYAAWQEWFRCEQKRASHLWKLQMFGIIFNTSIWVYCENFHFYGIYRCSPCVCILLHEEA